MKICDAQYFEAMKEHREACSKVTNPIIEAPTIDQLLVQVASGEESVINMGGQQTQSVENVVLANSQLEKGNAPLTSPRGKKSISPPNGKEKV